MADANDTQSHDTLSPSQKLDPTLVGQSTPTPLPPTKPEVPFDETLTPTSATSGIIGMPITPSEELDGTLIKPDFPPTKVGSATISPSHENQQMPGGPRSFELIKELGRGAMGVVYKARQVQLNRMVALKMVLGGGYASQEELDRFRNEAAAIAKLSHPAIVQVYEIGEHNGMPYFAMEYCPGGTLATHCNGHPLHADQAARIVALLSEGMHQAHQSGIIHRDLKPSNVLVMKLDGAGRPIDGPSDLTALLREGRGELSSVGLKVADFGLARQQEASGHTRSGDLLGTPSYMAPEQASAHLHLIGPETDVWALGAILYDLLAGRPPFRGGTVMETVRLVIDQEPVPLRALRPDLPRDLETICHKCLQKDKTKRYTTAKELAEDLTRFIERRPIAARPVGVVERAARWARRKPALATLSAALSVVVLLGLVGWGVFTAELKSQRDRADDNARAAINNLELAEINERRANDKADEALENFRLAEARFLMAMRVVDRYFTEVSESTLLHEAGMEPLRRSLLRNARDFYTEFVKRRDGDESVARELARSQYRLGLIESDLGEAKESVRLLSDALKRFEALKDEDTLMDRALALHHRARVARQIQPDRAATDYDAALNLWRELKKRTDRPEHHAGEATTLLGVGNLATERRQYEQAKTRYAEVSAIRRKLAEAHPMNEAYQRDLATACQNLAAISVFLKDKKTASEARAEAIKTQRQLVRNFPGRAKYREDLGMSLYNRGEDDLRDERPADALASYQQAVQMFAALAQAHPEVPRYRERLADALGQQAFAYEDPHRSKDAISTRRLSIEVRRDLIKDFPDVPTHEIGLIRGLRQAAERALFLEEPEEARKNITEARERLETLVAKKVGGDLRLLTSEVLHEVGRTDLVEEKLRAARESFELALKTIGDDNSAPAQVLTASCLNLLAWICRLEGVPEDALPFYVRVESSVEAMRKDPRFARQGEDFAQKAILGRAQAFDEMGRFDDALVQWSALLKRQTGPLTELTEAQRLATLAATPKYNEAAESAEKLLGKANAVVRYELARTLARAATSASREQNLAQDERIRRVDGRRAAALTQLAGLAKEGAFRLNSARRRLLSDSAFVELRTTDEWKGLVQQK